MKKLRLNDLQIKSFVTSVDKQVTKTVKGGISNIQQSGCYSASPQECFDNKKTISPNCPTNQTSCNCIPPTWDGPLCDHHTIIVTICYD